MRRWVAILLIGLILFPVPLLAAVTVDSSAGCGGTNSASCSLTIAADANAVMVCFTQRDTGSAVQPGVSASVGGQAATFLGGAQNSGNSTRVEFWYKLAPLTGPQTIAVTGDAATDRLAMAAVSLKNVAQTSTFNTKSEIGSTVNGTNADLDGIASAVGEFVFLCGGARVQGAAPSPDATAPVSTEIIEQPFDSAGVSTITWAYSEAGASPTVNMRMDLAASDAYALVAASIRELVVAATGRNRGAVLLP